MLSCTQRTRTLPTASEVESTSATDSSQMCARAAVYCHSPNVIPGTVPSGGQAAHTAAPAGRPLWKLWTPLAGCPCSPDCRIPNPSPVHSKPTRVGSCDGVSAVALMLLTPVHTTCTRVCYCDECLLWSYTCAQSVNSSQSLLTTCLQLLSGRLHQSTISWQHLPDRLQVTN